MLSVSTARRSKGGMVRVLCSKGEWLMLTIILIMVIIMAVFFGILAQMPLPVLEPLPAPEPLPIQPDTKERESEKDEGQRRWQEYQDRRDDSDSGLPYYQYVKRLKYG